MTCATCGGGSRRTTLQPLRGGASLRGRVALDPDEAMGLVEFTGHGTRTYKGQSGTLYRFGDDAEHKQRRVREQDLDRLLTRSDYKLLEAPMRTRRGRKAEENYTQEAKEPVSDGQQRGRRQQSTRAREEEARQAEAAAALAAAQEAVRDESGSGVGDPSDPTEVEPTE